MVMFNSYVTNYQRVHSVKRQKCFWLRLVKRIMTLSHRVNCADVLHVNTVCTTRAREVTWRCAHCWNQPLFSALRRFLRSVTTQKTREIEFEIEMAALYKMLGEVPAKLKSQMDRRAESACTLTAQPARECWAWHVWWNMPVAQSSGILFYNLIVELWRRLLCNILGPKVCETLFRDMERFCCQKIVEACCQKVTSSSTFAKIKRLLKESRITRPCTQNSGRPRVLESLPHNFQTSNLYWFKIVVTVSSQLDLDKARSRSSVQHTWTFCYTLCTTLHFVQELVSVDGHLDAWDVSHLEMCGYRDTSWSTSVLKHDLTLGKMKFIIYIYMYVYTFFYVFRMYSCIHSFIPRIK